MLGKSFAWFGWHRAATPVARTLHRDDYLGRDGLAQDSLQAEPVLVKIQEGRGSRIAIMLATLSAACAMVSAGADIAGI
ncbi:hypothetical protein GCM10027614_15700 [Micromonospora vulcania]